MATLIETSAHESRARLTASGVGGSADPFPTAALNLWQERKAFFQVEEAKASDPAQKFTIRQEIKAAEAKIQELAAVVPATVWGPEQAYRSLRPQTRFEDLFEVIRESEEVLPAFFAQRESSGSNRVRQRLLPFHVPYVSGREGLSDVGAALEKALAKHRRRVLVCGPSGWGKTREVAEFARALCERGWWICLRQGSDAQMDALAGLSDELRGEKLLVVLDNLENRLQSPTEGRGPYLDRLRAFWESLERWRPERLYFIATARTEPQYAQLLGLDVAQPAWNEFGVFLLPEFTTTGLEEILRGMATRAEVPVEPQAIAEFVRRSDLRPSTFLLNVNRARQKNVPLTRDQWLPIKGDSWDTNFDLVCSEYPAAGQVLQAVRLFVAYGQPARVAYVDAHSRSVGVPNAAEAVAELVNEGLLGLRLDQLTLYSEDEVAARLGPLPTVPSGGADHAGKPAVPHPVAQIFDAVRQSQPRPPEWSRDLAQLAFALVSAGLSEPAEAAATLAIEEGDGISARFARALIHVLRGNSDLAEADLDPILAENPDHPQALFARGMIRTLRAEFEPATHDFDRAIARGKNDALTFSMRAAARFRLGQLSPAEEDLTAALAGQPQDAHSRFLRGIIRFQLKNLAGAEEDFSALIATGLDLSRSIQALSSLARGDAADLIRSVEIQSVAGRRADDGLAYGFRGITRLLAGNFAGAADDLKTAIELGFSASVQRMSGAMRGPSLPIMEGARGELEQAQALLGDDSGLRLMRAQALMELGRREEAEPELTQVIARGANLAEAYFLRGRLQLEQNRLEAAESDLSAALEQGRRDPFSRYLRGAIRLDLGRPREAEEDFDAVIRDADANPMVYFARGQARMRQRNLAGAEADATRALELGKTDEKTYLLRAAARLDQGNDPGTDADCTEALRLISQATEPAEKEPESTVGAAESPLQQARRVQQATAFFLRGVARHRRLRLAEAEADLAEAGRWGKQDAPLLSARAALRVDQGRFEDAQRDGDAALALAPGDPVALSGRGLAFLGLNRFAEAEADFSGAIAAQRDDAWIYQMRGLARRGLGNESGAEADFSVALERDPKNPASHAFRAAARSAQANHAGAVDDWTAALAGGRDDAEAYLARGQARLHLPDQLAGAEADFQAALARGRDDAEAHFLLGVARRALGKQVDAERDLTAALQRDAENPQIRAVRGHVRLIRGRMIEAEEDFTAALARDPKNVDCLLWRGMIRVAQGDAAAGLRDFQEAAALTPQATPETLGLQIWPLAHLGRLDDAERVGQTLTQLNADHPDTLGWRGVVHFGRQECAEAVTLLQSAVQAAAEEDWQLWLGLALLWSNQFPEARAAYARGFAVSSPGDLRVALAELEFWERQHPGPVSSPAAREVIDSLRQDLRQRAEAS